jgi:hypothetical protein
MSQLANVPEEPVTSTAAEYALFSSPHTYGCVQDGKITSRKAGPFEEPRTSTVVSGQYEMTLPLTVEHFSEVRIPMGLTIVVGKTGVGKSDFLRCLELPSSGVTLKRVLAVEPADSFDELVSIPIFSSADAALMYLVKATQGVPVLGAIDSLREPLFEINGPAGAKGVIMPFFTAVTRVSNSLALNGFTMLATINPMDEDPDYVKSFLSKLSASVPAIITLEQARVQRGSDHRILSFVFEGTISARPDRTARRFKFTSSSEAAGSAEMIQFALASKEPSSCSVPQMFVPREA